MHKPLDHASIVIVGVGGQGTLLASQILGAIAMQNGWNVKVSEVHGMSQRGGTVITYIRFGDSAVSPLIEMGGADYILAFEQMEAVRALPYCKADGTIICNTQKINPMSVVTGASAYPDNLLPLLREKVSCVSMDAYAAALAAGEQRAVNLVLLGVLCAITKGDVSQWEQAIHAYVPSRFIETNLRAFSLGVRYENEE